MYVYYDRYDVMTTLMEAPMSYSLYKRVNLENFLFQNQVLEQQ